MEQTYSRHWIGKALLALMVLALFFCIPFIPMSIERTPHYGLKVNRQAPEFNLKNHLGEKVTLGDFRGKHLFLMFGYLNCQDICHSQALIFQEINHLVDNKSEVHFLYISMDPERDNAERLALYFDSRAQNFTSLRSDDFTRAQDLAVAYKAFFSREYGFSKQDYGINHNASYFLIDPNGYIRHVYRPEQKNAREILSDLASLQNEYDS